MKRREPQRHKEHKVFFKFFLFFVSLWFSSPAVAQVLEQNGRIEREIKSGQIHNYKIAIGSNQFARIIVYQRIKDLTVALFDPDGKKLLEDATPDSALKRKHLLLITEAAGDYRLEINSPSNSESSGNYEVRIEELRQAEAKDRDRINACIAAERLFADAEKLYQQRMADSFRKAIGKYKESLSFWRVADDLYGEAVTLCRIGTTHRFLGDIQGALEYYKPALPLWRTLGNKIDEANTLNDIGLAYAQLGEKQIGLDYLNRALPLQQAANNRVGEAEVLNSLGQLYSLLGDNQKSLEHFNRVLLLWRAAGNKEGEIRALNNIATISLYQGEHQKALDYYNQVLAYQRATGNRSVEARVLNNIGLVYEKMGEKEKARDCFKQALVLWQAVGDAIGQGAGFQKIAMMERSLGNLEEALVNIEEALGIVESLRSSVRAKELRASYFSTYQNYYDFCIDLLVELNKKRPSEGFDIRALDIIERTRARNLLETLYEADIDIHQGVDPELLDRERALRNQLNDKLESRFRLLGGRPAREQIEILDREQREIGEKLQEIEAQIREKSPRYATLTQPQPLKAKEVQEQLLDDDTLLLEFALGNERSYLWAVSQNSIEVFELPNRKQIEEAVLLLRSLVTTRACNIQHETDEEARERVRKADADLRLKTEELSNLLLGPVTARLGNKRLAIVADGALHLLPFGILPIPTAGGGFIPLIEKHEIVNLPSASSLMAIRRELAGRTPGQKTIAILADPVFDSSDDRVKQGREVLTKGSESGKALAIAQRAKDSVRGKTCLNGQKFERLPGTRAEALSLLSLVPKYKRKEALDFDASISTAIDPQLKQYRIIHFGTHSFVPEESPELAGIVLSMVDRQGKEQNGYLGLSTIYNLNLPSELVTLSACETGVGKEIRGEGLVSLIRGFMYAGARRVVASSWRVDDDATAELMKRFYRYIFVNKLSPAAALRKAQLSMLHSVRWQSPYYWAAFQLQGEWKK